MRGGVVVCNAMGGGGGEASLMVSIMVVPSYLDVITVQAVVRTLPAHNPSLRS